LYKPVRAQKLDKLVVSRAKRSRAREIGKMVIRNRKMHAMVSKRPPKTFAINPFVHIYQKEKITLEIE
jgi:hypothetical protein